LSALTVGRWPLAAEPRAVGAARTFAACAERSRSVCGLRSAARDEHEVLGLRLALSGVEASAVCGQRRTRGPRSSVSGQIRSVSCVDDSHSLPCVSGGGLGWGRLRLVSFSGHQRAQRLNTSPLRRPSTTLRASLSSQERRISAAIASRPTSGRQPSTLNCQRAPRFARCAFDSFSGRQLPTPNTQRAQRSYGP
jgi:hypothetical protein